MNGILKIYSEISEKDRLNFISSCFAKQKNLFGCPRLIIQNKINKNSVDDLFLHQEKFKQIDNKFFPLINENDYSVLEHLGVKVLFDVCQNVFDEKDDIVEYLSEDVKKMFNLNIRITEQEKFITANSRHYGDKKTICEKVIYEKLNNLWKNRWSDSNSYINNLNKTRLML